MYVYVYADTYLHFRVDGDMLCAVVTYTSSRGETRARLLRVVDVSARSWGNNCWNLGGSRGRFKLCGISFVMRAHHIDLGPLRPWGWIKARPTMGLCR